MTAQDMSRLAEHLSGRPVTDVAALFAPTVHFASPYADYDDRRHIVDLFMVMPAVFDELRVLRQVANRDDHVTVLAGRVGERTLTGVLDERRDADGRVYEVALLLRPHAASRAAITRMGELLGGQAQA